MAERMEIEYPIGVVPIVNPSVREVGPEHLHDHIRGRHAEHAILGATGT
jgi:hypothetical protein